MTTGSSSRSPSQRPIVLQNIERGENIDTREAERRRALEELRRMSGSELSQLRTHLNTYKEKPESEVDATERQVIQEIENEIARIEERQTQRSAQEVVTPTGNEQQVEETRGAFSGIKNVFKSMMKTVIGFLPTSFLRGWVTKHPDSMFSEYIKDILAEEDMYKKMTDMFGAEGFERTNQDDDMIRELRTQYDAMTVPEGQTKMTFEQFYAKKMQVVKDNPNRPSKVRLYDIVHAQLDTQTAQQEATRTAEQQRAREREAQQIKENMERVPAVRNAVSVFAFARAIVSVGGSLGFTLDESKVHKDFMAQPEGDYYYKDVVEQIITWLKDEEQSGHQIGITIDGGDLEEADGTNWFWDWDMIPNFESNLRNSPKLAIDSLVSLCQNESEVESTNETAQAHLPALGRAIEAEERKILNTPPPAPTPTQNQTASAQPQQQPQGAPANQRPAEGSDTTS